MSNFTASYRATLTQLQKEMHLIGVEKAIIELDVPASRITKDGKVYAKTNVDSPRVAAVLLGIPDVGDRVLRTEKFTTWKHNLRAISLSMEHMRHPVRYEVDARNDQYRGFPAIEGQVGSNLFNTKQDAFDLILREAEEPTFLGAMPDSDEILDVLVRTALRNVHPDKGGTTERFWRVQEARKMLDQP